MISEIHLIIFKYYEVFFKYLDREEASEYIEIGSLNGLFVLGRTIGFIGKQSINITHTITLYIIIRSLFGSEETKARTVSSSLGRHLLPHSRCNQSVTTLLGYNLLSPVANDLVNFPCKNTLGTHIPSLMFVVSLWMYLFSTMWYPAAVNSSDTLSTRVGSHSHINGWAVTCREVVCSCAVLSYIEVLADLVARGKPQHGMII